MRRHTLATKTAASLVVLIVVVVGAWLVGRLGPDSSRSDPSPMATTQYPAADSSDVGADIQQLFDKQATDVIVTGTGVVTRLLSDDAEGDRHQRFIVEMDSGLTLLIAHNIDIAPRLEGVAVGDELHFHGEYAYSDQGGTIHWTHHDPDGSHEAGWLEWNRQRYS